MAQQIQFRRGTAAAWTAANPVLMSGELGLETDTSLFKIGNGVTSWNSLSYGGLVGATGPTGPAGSAGATGPTGPGVASGGDTNDLLLKLSGTNYDTVWTPRATLTDPARVYEYFDDFEGVQKMTSSVASGGLNSAGITGVSTANQVGIFRMRSTTAAGYATLSAATNSVIFGTATWSFETVLKTVHLSDGTDNYIFRAGFGDLTTGAEAADGAYFTYDTAVSPNWLMVTAQASARTTTATSVAVNTTNWVKLRLEVNAAATLVTYYINDASVGTISTNIPTGSNATGFCLQNVKVLNNTARDVYLDYVRYRAEWASGTRWN